MTIMPQISPSAPVPTSSFVAPVALPVSPSPCSPPIPYRHTLVCVARPEPSNLNLFSSAISLVTTWFQRPNPSSTTNPSSTKPSPTTPTPQTTTGENVQSLPNVDEAPSPFTTQNDITDQSAESNISNTINDDTDGLYARLRARGDDDGIKARLAARRRPRTRSQPSSDRQTPKTPSRTPALPTRAVTTASRRRRRSGGGIAATFAFLSRRTAPEFPSPLSRISDASIIALIDEACRRRRYSPANPHLITLLPYDLQRALFDDLTGKADASSWSSLDPPFPVSEAPSADAEKPSSPWHVVARISTDVFRFITFQPSAQSTTPHNKSTPTSSRSRTSPTRPNSTPAAAYTAAAVASDMAAAREADSDRDTAAAAYAAAAAIATSAATAVSPAEQEGLRAAVAAARAINNADDAVVFEDTVGVRSLVIAADVLPGIERAAALTALANIAIVLPKARVAMLSAGEGRIVDTIVDLVYRSRRFHAAQSAADGGLWYTEALVSGTHLLGSLALTKGSAGRVFRTKMAADADLVRRLKRLAGGLKNGEAEGAARASRRALGALGINEWRPRVPGQKGLRVLSIDGGGTRAILAFETLKHLKKMTGCEIHELFDVICGTSTGAIVAASIGLGHKTVEEVEVLYRNMIGKVFARNPVNGPKMLLTRAYYDTNVLETTLQRECGHGVFIDSLADENMNRVFVVSSVMSRDPKELFVFRNYTYPVGHESRYDGTAEAQLWEALRASSAAPTFFSEIRVDGELHADGAIVANNPTAVALHETKCMFPGVPIELLVSLGNGVNRSPQSYGGGGSSGEYGEGGKKNMGWGDVVGSIVASATSTETVHHAMQDLFPNDKYFRFNPTTDSTQIDETSAETLAMFVKEARLYIEQNGEEFEKVARLLRPQRGRDFWIAIRDALW